MKYKELKKENINNLSKYLDSNMCLIGIFNDMCAHCIIMRPEWNCLKTKIKNINGDGILLEINSKYINLINNPNFTNKINGYPSIFLYKNGILIKEYSGDRTCENMLSFIKPYIIYRKNKNVQKSVQKILKGNKKYKNIKSTNKVKKY